MASYYYLVPFEGVSVLWPLIVVPPLYLVLLLCLELPLLGEELNDHLHRLGATSERRHQMLSQLGRGAGELKGNK